MEDRCVVCGEIIPEGLQVCPACAEGKKKPKDYHYSSGYECFHCGEHAVIWDSDFDAEDYGYIDPGIVHQCHCANCGAEIQYYIPENPDK